MADKRNELLVAISGDDTGLSKTLRHAQESVRGFQQEMQRRLSSVNDIFSGLRGGLAAIGVTLGANAFKNYWLDTLNWVGGLAELADQLGVTTDTLQAFQAAGMQYGVSQSEIETSLSRFTRTVGEAAEGNKAAVESFQRLGVHVLDANRSLRPTDDLLREVVDSISKINDPAVRAAVGVDLFGKSFQRLLPLVNEGAGGFAAIEEQARALGLIFDEKLIRNADEAADKLALAAKVLQAQLVPILLQLAPVATAAADGLNSLFGGLNKAIDGEAARRLATINSEIEIWEQNQRRLEEGAPESWIAALFGTDGEPAKRLRELRAERDRILHSIMSRTDGVTPPAAAATIGALDPEIQGGGETAGEKAARKYQQALIDLGAEIDAFTQSGRDKLMSDWFKRAGNPSDPDQAAQLSIMVDEMFRGQIAAEGFAAAQAADKEAGAEWNAIMREAAAITDSVRTPLEAYNAELARATYLRDTDMISAETYNRVVERAGDAFVAADEKSQLLIQSAGQVGSGFVNAFSRIGQAGDDLDNVLQGLLQTLAQVASNLAGGGLESLIGDIIKAGLPAAGSALSADIDSMILANPEIFADGGIMSGRGRVPLRRYSAGGVARTPQLAMFAEGGVPEAYVPVPSGRIPVEMRGGGGGGGDVYITNNISVQGGTREQNQDMANRTARALERKMNDFIDNRLLYQQRPGGIAYGQHTVS